MSWRTSGPVPTSSMSRIAPSAPTRAPVWIAPPAAPPFPTAIEGATPDEQIAFLVTGVFREFTDASHPEDDIPDLPPLTASERLSWDYRTHGAARVHPMTLARRQLAELEVRPIETCYRFGRTVRTQAGNPATVTVAGITMLRQRPPTAKGVLFVTIEDETVRVRRLPIR